MDLNLKDFIVVRNMKSRGSVVDDLQLDSIDKEPMSFSCCILPSSMLFYPEAGYSCGLRVFPVEIWAVWHAIHIQWEKKWFPRAP